MNPAQLEVARHALGLPNHMRRSYRNRFVAGAGHSDFVTWLDLVRIGFAGRAVAPKGLGGDDLFWLTPPGAEAALKAGETLDAEDFPERGA
jgi:hypothetical protein